MLLKDKRTVIKYDIVFVMGVFLLAVTFHFWLGSHLKLIKIYWDELYLWDLAKSFFNGEGLSIRSRPTEYQKIGYPLLLAPLFAVNDPVLRVQLVHLLNSVLMCSSVFPMWLIGKEIGLNKKEQFLTIILLVIWPESLISMTFLSEAAYWPTSLWFMYLWLVNHDKKSYGVAVVIGLISYWGYLVKEIYLAFLLTYALFELIQPFDINNSQKIYCNKRIKLLFITLGTFFLCHFIAKLTMFYGMENSYAANPHRRHDQLSIGPLLTNGGISYLLYSAWYHMMSMLIGVFFIPIVYPIVYFKYLEKKIQVLLYYIVLFIIVVAFAIGYTISIRENLGRLHPDVHLRYFGPMLFMFMPVLFKAFDAVKVQEIKLNQNVSYTLMCFIFFIIMNFRWAFSNGVDQQILGWFSWIAFKLSFIYNSAKDTLIVNSIVNCDSLSYRIAILLCNVIVLIITYVFHRVFGKVTFGRSYTVVVRSFILFVFLLCGINDYLTYSILVKQYRSHDYEKKLENTLLIDDYFKNKPLVYVIYFSNGSNKKHVDTFTNIRKLYSVSSQFLISLVGTHKYQVSKTRFLEIDTINSFAFVNYYNTIRQAEYIIIDTAIEKQGITLLNVKKIHEASGPCYSVYENLDPLTLEVKIDARISP